MHGADESGQREDEGDEAPSRRAARSTGPLRRADFQRFDRIYAMDWLNLGQLEALRPRDHRGQLALFLDVVPELGVREVPDPYYGGPEGFDRVLDLIEASAAGLLARLRPTLTRG